MCGVAISSHTKSFHDQQAQPSWLMAIWTGLGVLLMLLISIVLQPLRNIISIFLYPLRFSQDTVKRLCQVRIVRLDPQVSNFSLSTG